MLLASVIDNHNSSALGFRRAYVSHGVVFVVGAASQSVFKRIGIFVLANCQNSEPFIALCYHVVTS